MAHKKVQKSKYLLKSLIDGQRKSISLKLTRGEKEMIQEKADFFARGNLSRWIRSAALNYRPSIDEIAEEIVEQPKASRR